MFGLSTFEYDDDGFRTCGVTGLHIHRSAEDMVKLFGLTAIVALLIGGIFAIFVALTRWELIGLLSPSDFYRYLSVHAWYLLIFWMVFMEIAILYVGGAFVLGRKLALPWVAKAGYALMAVGALVVTYGIWTQEVPNQAPLLTSYAPLPSPASFYLGAILFLLGALVAAVPFLGTVWREKREYPSKTLPLVTFGAFCTAIVAAEAIVGGLITFVPTFFWRIGWLAHIDAAWYRQMYWIIGHGSQQINLLAMITVWYFMTHVVGGAEVASEKVSRFAFVLYLFFINMGAAHHLMSDPAVGLGWRLWNTSYAAYGAVLASMIHAFAIPAGLEAGRRRKGQGGGLFGWLWSAPWRDPGFAATVMSIILFGFLGGITGVMMGQMQLNMTWHNTLAVPGHFHGTVATGTTLAFMGLGYYVVRLVFGREWVGGVLATIQPYLYAGAMSVAVLMMMYLGVLFGVPRRHPTVMDIPGTEFAFTAARPFFAVFGIAALVAIVGGALFVAVAVGSLLLGGEFTGDPRIEALRAAADGGDPADAPHHQSMRGTFVFVLVFFATFVVLWALNWLLLSQVWHVGP
ncbi:cytochrome c oxidase subunit I [Halorarius litoreus]|uniref:cytochrome c oxidase subunit I n=1 Tax=Halorarius litoreus TaxID=2962676 RepID=UPI0020CD0BF6|nr:cbb3-type cytochrome c oxidase subunit I [Halorarius litoreus]